MESPCPGPAHAPPVVLVVVPVLRLTIDKSEYDCMAGDVDPGADVVFVLVPVPCVVCIVV